MSGDDKGSISSAKRVCRCGEQKWAGRGGGSGAVSNSEPAEGADKVACGSSVDNAALANPIGGGAVGVNSGC